MTMIVSVVGLAGAGKSEAVAALQRLHAFERVYFGGLVMAEVARLGLPPGEASERGVREGLRAEHGMAAMAALSRRVIDGHLAAGKDVLIDGLYSHSELILLREAYGEALTLIAVQCHRSVREARLANRAVRPLTPEQMRARDEHEINSVEKAPPIVLADYQLCNIGGLKALETQLASILAEIRARA